MTGEPNRVGRPPKGERKSHLVRLPVQLSQYLEQVASYNGISVNEFVVEALAAQLGVPYPEEERLKLSA
ncbi:MAG: hypothetical protein H0T78_06835 [Longispora sp.]|nr:hypothetical protein [Longispora sp. (in: high G+C Gram-positive bacteria)]